MGEIVFNSERHEYMVDGILRPSVTEIIRAAGLMGDTEWFTEASRLRGQAVHMACEFLDVDDLDWDTVAPQHVGYVQAWERFKEETMFQPELIEHRVFNEALGYCGTLDRTGKIGQAKILLDIKTGAPERWHGVQLAAYVACLEKPLSFRRMTVHLRADGTYSITEYSPAQALELWNVFQSAVNIFNFKGGMNGNSNGRTSGVAA